KQQEEAPKKSAADWESLLLTGPVENSSVKPEVMGYRLGMTQDEVWQVMSEHARSVEKEGGGKAAFGHIQALKLQGPDALRLPGHSFTYPRGWKFKKDGAGKVKP